MGVIAKKNVEKMNDSTRKVLDKSFTALSYCALAAMGAAVLLFLLPIAINGAGAVFFNATVEHWKFLEENLGRELQPEVSERIRLADEARVPLVQMIDEFENPPFAAELEESLRKSFGDAVKGISGARADELSKIVSLENPERARRLKEFSARLWAPFVDVAQKARAKSDEDGTSIPLEKILHALEEELTDRVKAEISNFEKRAKLKFSVRQQVRRALCAPASKELLSEAEKLHAQNAAYQEFKSGVEELLGPLSAERKEELKLLRQRYGQPRLGLAENVMDKSVRTISVRERDSAGTEILKRVSSAEFFKGTKVGEMLRYIEGNFTAMLRPEFTAYWGFFFDDPYDSNIFGGIWPMILGTFYLTAGSMIIAAPLGICAAIYFSEYAKPCRLVSILQMCVGTLAGVPSIVFGLFGLAFLINTLKVSDSKSVLAGAITLALLVLPTIIRSCEEALKAVPRSYREAAFGLGAGKWKAIRSVILPAALPSMLTGIIISMGRAAGETAPIIFTAATSAGAALALGDVFTQPTPALPWNIYNLCSEHEMAERVAHVQYGMVLTLIAIVLALNFAAILIRAKLQRKMKA